MERQFKVSAPNKVWAGDITYLPTAAGWVYLAVILDLYSRKVVGWAMADHMRTTLCLEALRKALATREPAEGLVHHTDRGSQYASRDYRQALEAAGIQQSMSRKGNCWDNAPVESFFGTLEQELVRGDVWSSHRHAQEDVSDFIHRFYNPVRRHSTLGYRSPAQAEAEFRQSIPHAA